MQEVVPSSFRDPSGFLFRSDGILYRRVNDAYHEDYHLLMESGLYQELVEAGLLVSHEEVSLGSPIAEGAYKILKPEVVPFISYPYEWSFSQIKDAAITTLEIQKRALAHGISLKDASAFNIQFVNGKPVLIDTLSFEKYVEGYPWVAYKQFCQHFLAPLALMSMTDVRLNQLARVYIDGVPLDLASKLLPRKSRWSFSLQLHIHLHAKSQAKYSDTVVDKSKFAPKVSRQSLLGLVDNLQSTAAGLKWNPGGTEWADYYNDDSYVPEGFKDKQRIIRGYFDDVKPATVWDLGANTGLYSYIAAEKGANVISFDIDPACVEKNYLKIREDGQAKVLPLLLDLTNPSPQIGWDNDERMSVPERGPADMITALALVHHLAISNNVPLPRIASFMAQSCNSLIIEFVPKSDHKVKKLLATREDVFPNYTQEGFEAAFSQEFEIVKSDRIQQSERTLYLMAKRK